MSPKLCVDTTINTIDTNNYVSFMISVRLLLMCDNSGKIARCKIEIVRDLCEYFTFNCRIYVNTKIRIFSNLLVAFFDQKT